MINVQTTASRYRIELIDLTGIHAINKILSLDFSDSAPIILFAEGPLFRDKNGADQQVSLVEFKDVTVSEAQISVDKPGDADDLASKLIGALIPEAFRFGPEDTVYLYQMGFRAVPNQPGEYYLYLRMAH